MGQLAGGIILAGGKSRRMGTPKHVLHFQGKSFLALMQQKMQAAGVSELVISCGFPIENARTVKDLYIDSGPLGGIYSCLSAATYEINLVLSVDLPLLPTSLIKELLSAYSPSLDCLYLTCQKQAEPLISVWHKRALVSMRQQLDTGNFSVIHTIERLHSASYSYLGDPHLIQSCNTPAAYQQLSDNQH